MKNISLIITLFLSFGAFSQNWIDVTKDKFGNKYLIKSTYFSKGNDNDFTSTPTSIKIWTKKIVLKIEDKTSKGKGKIYYNPYIIELSEFDCENSKSRVLSRIAYTSKGGVIMSEDLQYSDWNFIIPESVGETILNKVCELYN